MDIFPSVQRTVLFQEGSLSGTYGKKGAGAWGRAVGCEAVGTASSLPQHGVCTGVVTPQPSPLR